MINNLYNIASKALNNAQVSVDNASNNIANANTTGYQRTEVVYESGDSITISGLTVGTGADVTAIVSQYDTFIEAQYLEASSELARQSAALDYLDQLDTLLDQDDGALNDILSEFLTAWTALSADPDSSAEREDLLGVAETLVYELNTTLEQLDTMVDTINTEIVTQIQDANSLIEDIASANAAIVANPDDNTAVSERDQMLRDLNEIIGIEVIYQDNGEVTVMTEEGYTLVDGTETHSLAYQSAHSTETLRRDSEYDGTIEFSGTSSEEILIEFVTTGTDGTAQFKVSTDGGNTWLTDDNGDTLLYTAGDEDNSVTIEGVEIWFEDGTAEHAVGDRYTVMAKSGLYWESDDGSLQNITPMTDDSGSDVSGRTSSGSLAGLFIARDDTVVPTMDGLDDLAESLIWEVNSIHSQGGGTEGHTTLTGSYSADDQTATLSNSGLYYADNITSGEIQLLTYDADGNVSTSAIVSVDPATDSLDDVVSSINAAFGGELTASVTSDGQLQITAAADMTFEIGGDTSNLLAAAGLNTFFTGTDASSIALDSYVTTNTAHLNAGVVGSDGLVSSGSNDTADAIASLANETVQVGDSQTTLSAALATIVSDVGSAASTAELQATYAQTSADYFYNQQASITEVNIDEELIELTKYQQAYQAAAEILSVTREMMDIILDIV